MTLRAYIILVVLATILCFGSFLFVIYQIDPTKAGFIGFSLFYLSFFCWVVGFLSLLGLGLRVWLIKEEPVFRFVLVSFRQALLIASVFTIALFLQSQHLLSIVNIILLVAGFLFIELFLSKTHTR